MRDAMNIIVADLDEETRKQIIEESKRVFEFNNSIVKTVRGSTSVLVSKLVKWSLVMAVISMSAVIMYRYLSPQAL